MGTFCNFAEDKIVDHALGITSWTMPSSVGIALVTVDPDDAGAFTNEVSTTGTAYARYECAGATTWNASSGGGSSNKVAITFPTCAGTGWGTVHGFIITSGFTEGAGDAIAWGVLGTEKTIGVGDTASFAIGALTVSLD